MEIYHWNIEFGRNKCCSLVQCAQLAYTCCFHNALCDCGDWVFLHPRRRSPGKGQSFWLRIMGSWYIFHIMWVSNEKVKRRTTVPLFQWGLTHRAQVLFMGHHYCLVFYQGTRLSDGLSWCCLIFCVHLLFRKSTHEENRIHWFSCFIFCSDRLWIITVLSFLCTNSALYFLTSIGSW